MAKVVSVHIEKTEHEGIRPDRYDAKVVLDDGTVGRGYAGGWNRPMDDEADAVADAVRDANYKSGK